MTWSSAADHDDPYDLRPNEVRRTGENIWRPSGGHRLAWFVVGTTYLAAIGWLASEDALLPMSIKDKILVGAAGISLVTLLPVVLFRWRMVLDSDVLALVFLRVRQLPVREIVDAKTVRRKGVTFVLRDGREESFGAVGNTAWGHRREAATRADLAARAVLCAAASARGEAQPSDYRLPPMMGLKRSVIEGGVWALILGFLFGS